MQYHIYALILTAIIFVFLFLLLLLGKKIGLKDIEQEDQRTKVGITQVEGAIFALLGLLIAFTFYGASQRYDARRQFIVNETNAISTAYLRIDLLPSAFQPQMRDLFKEYATARLDVNQLLPNIQASEIQMEHANQLQDKIWQIAVAANQNAPVPLVAVIVLPALNSMFDIATAHNVSLITHPPITIYFTLLILLGCTSFFVGYGLAGSKKTNWLHGIGYSFIMVAVFYVILDFEFPRAGFINVKYFDKPMIELIQKMS
ncbi:MAG: DUF4239 domain-containing protein [Candidatus Berkiellales bacterium]